MAEKRINDCAGTSYSDFQQKRFRTSSSENTAQSNNYGADRSESTALGNEHYNGATDDSEHLEDSDDDDADRSLLYCILLSDHEEIDLNKDDWYQKLTDIRKSCSIKNRSREEDILSIQSMSKTSSALRLYGSTVSCFSEILDENEDDRVYKCLTFNKDYERFIKVTPTEVFRKCMPGYFIGIILRTCDISDFVWKAGLDFFNIPIDCLIENQEKTLDGLEILNLPFEVELFTTEFKEYVENIMELEQKSLQSLNLNSLLGSFLIGGQERKEKGKQRVCLFHGTCRNNHFQEEKYNRHLTVLDKLSLSQTKWNILVSILTSETYSIYLNTQLEEQSTKIQEAFPLLTCESKVIDKDINELVEISEVIVLYTEINKVGFISDDVRHQVMSYFVKNCLITDDDFENYIKLSSVDSLLEYIRTWWFENEKCERCLYLPERMEEAFIQRLGLDVVRHVMVEVRKDSDGGSRYKKIREKVQENLKVPEEIFDWEYEARCRYVECAKRGTKTIHRARAMIVGCAGAGKTTLLKRLQKLGLEELMKVKSTVGLEVHEDMFELGDGNSLKALSDATNKDEKQILSVVDFGGQCAYYACHQVYLSRRAFYLLVIDMSRPFNEKVDENRCDQRKTMFADWTYGEYVLFWLKSVHTYCAEDTSIIIVATHSENISREDKTEFYGQLLDLLPRHSNLKKHLNHERCFFVNFPGQKSGELDLLSEIENCIVSIAKDKRWKETIPKEWSMIELALINLKGDFKKIIPMTELEEKYWRAEEENVMKLQDALRFFHDVGLILYFDEENLSDTIVVDVQWFVDTFKFIISDKNHVRDLAETNEDWEYFYMTGYLKDSFLLQVWEKLSIDLIDRPTILHYMQRLGLLAIGKVKHYVPCMNKRDFGRNEQIALRGMETKSSVLVFHFHFLPFFFYCRLIVACIVGTKWIVVEDDDLPGLYKNIAIFIYKDHLIALAVTTSAIQVQILRPQNAPINAGIAVHIKKTLESRLRYLTSTFHKKVAYRLAFQCSGQDVLCKSEGCHVYEEEIYEKGEILCPRHGITKQHMIIEEDLTKFWKTETPSVSCDESLKGRKGNRSKLHDMAVQEPEEFHRRLVADLVSDYLDKSIDEGRVFIKWKQYFKILYPAPRYQSTTIYEDFNKLEADGKLSVNNYKTLKGILKNVDQRAVQRVVECEENLSSL